MPIKGSIDVRPFTGKLENAAEISCPRAAYEAKQKMGNEVAVEICVEYHERCYGEIRSPIPRWLTRKRLDNRRRSSAKSGPVPEKCQAAPIDPVFMHET
ncbi:MAG: hypothetical protein ABIR62_09425 [Dokdonella sp.]|uniref:hypothetical protein n=1 Tax=Dokdonella sp. TaxID=2291710 RepID=UPI00326794C2